MAIPANTLVWSNAGELVMLRNALYSTGTPPRNWKFRLFQNDYTPDAALNNASVVQGNFTGYSPVNSGAWTNPTTVSAVAVTEHGTVTFACGSSGITSNNIYGWYITDNDNADEVLAACRMVAVPVLMFAPLQELRITPQVSMRTLGS